MSFSTSSAFSDLAHWVNSSECSWTRFIIDEGFLDNVKPRACSEDLMNALLVTAFIVKPSTATNLAKIIGRDFFSAMDLKMVDWDSFFKGGMFRGS